MDSLFHEKSYIAIHIKWQQGYETSQKSEMIAIKSLIVKQLYLMKTAQQKSNLAIEIKTFPIYYYRENNNNYDTYTYYVNSDFNRITNKNSSVHNINNNNIDNNNYLKLINLLSLIIIMIMQILLMPVTILTSTLLMAVLLIIILLSNNCSNSNNSKRNNPRFIMLEM